MIETLAIPFKHYLTYWSMLPWWAQLLLLGAAVYLSVFKLRAPQRVTQLWLLSFIHALTPKDDKDTRTWINTCTNMIINNDKTPLPQAPKTPPQKPQSSFQKAYSESRTLRIVVWLAIAVTIAEVIILSLKALDTI